MVPSEPQPALPVVGQSVKTSTGLAIALTLGVAAWTLKRYADPPYRAEIEPAAKMSNIDPALMFAIAEAESAFNARAISPPNKNGTRDYGLFQINESTARSYGIEPTRLVGDAELAAKTAARLLVDNAHTLLSKDKLTTPNLISSFNQGVGNVLNHGILNTAYVSKVQLAALLYSLARIFSVEASAPR